VNYFEFFSKLLTILIGTFSFCHFDFGTNFLRFKWWNLFITKNCSWWIRL